MTDRPCFEVEPTVFGTQTLVEGVVPITQADRLAWRANTPLLPKKPQRPADHGLFDLHARAQIDLTDWLSSSNTLPPPDPGDG